MGSMMINGYETLRLNGDQILRQNLAPRRRPVLSTSGSPPVKFQSDDVKNLSNRAAPLHLATPPSIFSAPTSSPRFLSFANVFQDPACAQLDSQRKTRQCDNETLETKTPSS